MKSPDTPRILIADDQPDVLEALRFLVKGEGYQSETVNSPAGAIDSVESRDFDAVLMDLNYTRDTTSGQEGLELLNRIQTLDTTLPVIVMTAWGSVELAVEAMRRGARDFIQKPWDNARLSAILKTQIELGRALRKGQRLEAENRALRAERFPQLIAQSAAMRPVLDVISRVGPSDANVLITGKTVPARGWWRRHCTRFRCAPLVRWSRSIPADWRRAFSRASFLDTSKAPLPTPRSIA